MRNSEAKREEILQYIRSEIEKKGYPPSVREICKAVNLKSTSTVFLHLQTLEERGLIRRDSSKPRALEIMDGTSPRSRAIPVLGQVTAGVPILASQNIEEYVSVPTDMADSDSFILNVRGVSMIDAGILDGDRIIVHKQNNAENGDIVVAMIDDEATVKRIYFERDHIRLQPENQTMKPIIVRDVVVLGRVTGLFRVF